MGSITIWTDGSCLKNPGGPGGWAFVREHDGTTGAGAEAVTTNNRMELMAIIRGLRSVDEASNVVVRTDSKYAIGCAVEWRDQWVRRKMKRVKNPDLIQELWEEIDRHKSVKFRWVRGHSGAVLNEKADKLAQEQAIAVAKGLPGALPEGVLDCVYVATVRGVAQKEFHAWATIEQVCQWAQDHNSNSIILSREVDDEAG